MPEFRETEQTNDLNVAEPFNLEWPDAELSSVMESPELPDEVSESLDLKVQSSEEKLSDVLQDFYDPAQIERANQVIASAKEAASSEREKENIGLTGDHLLWIWGYNQGDDPPESSVIVKEGDANYLLMKPQYIRYEEYSNAYDALHAAGWKDVKEVRKTELKNNEARLQTCFEEIISESPVHESLRSLAIQSPYDDQPRSLNEAERMIRESQAEQETKRQFGLTAGDRIMPGTDAARSLQRQNYIIDSEEVRERATSDPSQSMEPIKGYFADIVKGMLPDGEWRTEIDGKAVELCRGGDRRHLTLRTEEPLSCEIPSVSIKDVANNILDQFELSDLDRDIAYTELYVGQYNIFAHETADEFLTMSKTYGAMDISRTLTESGYVPVNYRVNSDNPEVCSAEDYREEHKLHSLYRDAIEKPPETPKNNETIEDNSPGVAKGFSFSDRKTLEQKSKKRVGSIIGHEMVSDTRLIRGAAKNSDLPPAQGHSDLVFITDNKNGFVNVDPDIPGYELTSRTNNVYEFAKRSSDPHQACQVEIPLSGKNTLAAKYKELGLDDLSTDILAVDQLTVSDLSDLIKNNSNYYVPEKAIEVAKHPTFEDFNNFVEDGNLRTQCTGSAHFLRLSLDTVFGDESCKMVTGFKLGDSKKVTGLLHAQAQFEHDGEIYILDATPSEKVLEPTEHGPTSKLATQFNLLENNLRTIFKAPDNTTLHVQLSKFPDHDPSRRALETLSGQYSSQQAADNLEYIVSIKQAVAEKDPRLKQLGIGNYSVDMLDLLANQVEKARSLLAEMGK